MTRPTNEQPITGDIFDSFEDYGNIAWSPGKIGDLTRTDLVNIELYTRRIWGFSKKFMIGEPPVGLPVIVPCVYFDGSDLIYIDADNNRTTYSLAAVSGGDMLKSAYDTTNNGIVDNSERLNNQLAAYYLARANHTGTQIASTISDFDTQVRTSRLEQMAAPAGSVSMNSQKITNLAAPTDNNDAATKAYADGLVVGLIDDRGNHDASGNVFPSSGGSGTAGAVLKGDLWTVSIAGILGGVAVTVGDVIRALVDTPGQTAANWAVTENNVGYVPENASNKATTMTGNTSSNTVFLSAKAVYDRCVTTFASISGSISQAFGALSIELGHATDTTLSRLSAGVFGVEGVAVPTVSSTNTLTNKRITRRVSTNTSLTTSVTIDSDSFDKVLISAQAGALLFNNPSGTPTEGQLLWISIKDNGTARALTYGSQFRSMQDTLPTTTTVSKWSNLLFQWNTTDSKWDLLALNTQA